MNNNNYRYQLERYRGRGSRYTCPQCGRKQSFTRYIDTYNNNIYINDNVGKCNRLDKCGYHYTPKQYFTDNPWKSDGWLVGQNHRENNQPTTPNPQPHGITSLSLTPLPTLHPSVMWVYFYIPARGTKITDNRVQITEYRVQSTDNLGD